MSPFAQEAALHWAAVALYIAATVLFANASLFAHSARVRRALRLTAAATHRVQYRPAPAPPGWRRLHDRQVGYEYGKLRAGKLHGKDRGVHGASVTGGAWDEPGELRPRTAWR